MGVIITSAIILVVSVLLQKQEGGLGTAFGGGGSSYRSKRGAEKMIFYLTIISATIFMGTSLVVLILK